MKIILFLLIFILGYPPCHAQSLMDDLKQELQNNLDSIARINGVPGISFSILFDNDNQINLASGFADIEKEQSITPQHKLLAGSVGKLFFAAITLKLIEEGKIALNDHISNFLKDKPWYKTFPNNDDIKIINLLNHTSGLPRHLFQSEFLQDFIKNPLEKRLPENCIQSISNKPPVHPVDKGWSYSDTNYILLGLIIKNIIKDDIYNLVQNDFIKPLDLKNTVPSTTRSIEGLSNGYVGSQNLFQLPEKVLDKQGNLVLDPSFEWTGGGFATTPSDLVKFLKFIHESNYLNEESKKQMKMAINMATGQPFDDGYGLGTFVYSKINDTRYGHSGFFPGYVSHVEYSTNRQYALAIQINHDGAYPLLQQILYTLEQTVESYLDRIDEIQILKNFKIQETCWNNEDITCYMKAYANDEAIQTISKAGVTYDYKNIINSYKKYFPKGNMGKLHFDNLNMRRLSDNLYFVTGRFNLKFKNSEDLYQGWFSVNMKRLKGTWKMITDHSS